MHAISKRSASTGATGDCRTRAHRSRRRSCGETLIVAPAPEPLHGDDLAAQAFGDPRLDAGALRLERFVVDRVLRPRHGVIVGLADTWSPNDDLG